MTRRFTGNMNGGRFLANRDPRVKEVHDLDNEQTGEDECEIDEIIAAGFDDSFDSLPAARFSGYRYCQHCIGDQPKT